MRHRRTSRVVLSVLLASGLAVGLGSGASATVALTPEAKDTTTAPFTGANDPTRLLTAAPLTAELGPVAPVPLASVVHPATDSLTDPASADGGVGDLPGVSVWQVTPDPDETAATLGALLDSLIDPAVNVQACPIVDFDTRTCDEAHAVVRAISPCLATFTTGARASTCDALVSSAIALLTRIAAEGNACASGNNNVCATVGDAVGSTTPALLACVGLDPSLINATRGTLVTRSDADPALWALCGQVVTAGTEVAGQAIAAAVACANGGDPTCSNVVATVVEAASSTLRCVGAQPLPLADGGDSLLAVDLYAACEAALITARDTLAAVAQRAQECANGTDAVCRDALDTAGAAVAQIRHEAQDAATEAAKCLGVDAGMGDGSGELVAACQDVQDRVAAALDSSVTDDCASEVERTAPDAQTALDTPPIPAPPTFQDDPEDPGYLPFVLGTMTGTFTDCAPDQVTVAGTTVPDDMEVSVSEGATLFRMGKESDPDPSDQDYSSWGLRSVPSRYAEYGDNVRDSSDTWGQLVLFFDTKQAHRSGRLMVWITKNDLSIRTNGQWKAYNTISQLWHNVGGTQFFDSAPLGSADAESSPGYTFTIGVAASNTTNTGTVGVGWEKPYGIEYTTFGGYNLRYENDAGQLKVYGNEGGYLNIAHCHRSNPRYWAQGLVLLMPKGSKAKWGIRLSASLKDRTGDKKC